MRGGKRTGAGRKPTISDPLERLFVGSECQQLWREAIRSRRNEELSKRIPPELRDEYGKLQNIPAKQRRAWLMSFEGRDTIDDIRGEIRNILGTPDDVDDADIGRLLPISVARPMNLRQRIIDQVAKTETSNRGRTITPRLVADCWKEFRAAEALLKADQDDV